MGDCSGIGFLAFVTWPYQFNVALKKAGLVATRIHRMAGR